LISDEVTEKILKKDMLSNWVYRASSDLGIQEKEYLIILINMGNVYLK